MALDTTTLQIAKQAEITEVTLFRHFSSKQEILLEGIEPILFSTLEGVISISKESSGTEKLESILYDRISLISKNYQIIKNGSIKTKYKNTYIKKNINMSLTKDEYKKIDTKINYYENNATNIIGEIEVSLKGKTYIKENIYQKEETKEKKLNSWQKFIRKIGLNG